MNKFIKYNNMIENYIKRFISFKLKSKFNSINNLYNMKFNKNSNYIKASIKIEEGDLNKKIQIINHDNNSKIIKDNCIIEIDNEIIPFSFTKEFSKKGEYIIKYYFLNDLCNAKNLFAGCSKLTTSS